MYTMYTHLLSHCNDTKHGLSHGTCGHDLEGLGLDSGLEELH